MSRDLKEELVKVEMAIFSLEMKDHWTEADFQRQRELEKEKDNLKRMIEEGQNE